MSDFFILNYKAKLINKNNFLTFELYLLFLEQFNSYAKNILFSHLRYLQKNH